MTIYLIIHAMCAVLAAVIVGARWEASGEGYGLLLVSLLIAVLIAPLMLVWNVAKGQI